MYKTQKRKIKYIFIIFIVVFFCFYFMEKTEKVGENVYTLKDDGICILYNPEYTTNYDILETDILQNLPSGYLFLDYVYKIENSSLSTFHRDVTSSQYIYKTKYPVYTAILYKYSGELLSFCPGSNFTYPFVWSRIVNMSGSSGTVFLFNCDILHAGCDNNCALKREVVQYKICHVEDVDLLKELSGIRMLKREMKCKTTIYNKIMRKASYFFEMPINTFLYPLMLKRETKNNIIERIQEYIPISFYNN